MIICICPYLILCFIPFAIAPDSHSNRTELYERITRCLTINTHSIGKEKTIKLELLEHSDAKKHYEEILEFTSIYRNRSAHGAGGFAGPWIENLFISHFIGKPFEYFNGFTPLFIQWVDIHVDEMMSKKPSIRVKNMFRKLTNILRPNTMYIAVSQDDEGIGALQQSFPNILTLSAGGYGHIPIPLIKGELEYREPPADFKWDVGFVGKRGTHVMRSEMFGEVKCVTKSLNMSLSMQPRSSWQDDIHSTKFNLAPRGFGRTSYRAAEVVQLGRIPVYIYDDVSWMPYKGTDKDFHHIGFVSQIGHINEAMTAMHAKTKDEIRAMLTRVKNVRHHYTYSGLLTQMEQFFSDPLGPRGGDLRKLNRDSTVARFSVVRISEKDQSIDFLKFTRRSFSRGRSANYCSTEPLLLCPIGHWLY
eukprot:gene156-260_t